MLSNIYCVTSWFEMNICLFFITFRLSFVDAFSFHVWVIKIRGVGYGFQVARLQESLQTECDSKAELESGVNVSTTPSFDSQVSFPQKSLLSGDFYLDCLCTYNVHGCGFYYSSHFLKDLLCLLWWISFLVVLVFFVHQFSVLIYTWYTLLCRCMQKCKK